MKHKKWWILLSVASVLLMFCAVRTFWRPAASDGAHRIEARESRARSGENQMDLQLKKALERIDADKTKAADAATLKELETAKEAQLKQQVVTETQLKEQEAAKEAQLTQPETPLPMSENPGLPIDAVVRKGDAFYAIIGERLVREGDMVNGYRVLKISADGVEFEKGGPVFIQKMD